MNKMMHGAIKTTEENGKYETVHKCQKKGKSFANGGYFTCIVKIAKKRYCAQEGRPYPLNH